MSIRLLCVIAAMAALSGCMVSQGKYEAAVSDMETAKAELEKMRMHRDALEQEINTLNTSHETVSTDLEMMTEEVERIKAGRKDEQALLGARTEELERHQRDLLDKNKRLAKQYQKLRSQNRALKDTVVRYQKELKATRERNVARAAPHASARLPKKSARPSVGETAASSHAAADAKTDHGASTSASKGHELVNINKASVSDLVLFLGLPKTMAEGVVANRPYRLRGELVAKRVVPKDTFETIKERITAAR